MSATTFQLTLRSRAAKYGFMFLALAGMFLYFAFDGYRQHRPVETTMWIAVLFLATSGGFFGFARHRAIEQINLLKSGRLGHAVITAVGKTKFMRSGDTFTEVEYRYEPSPGQMFEGKTALLIPGETPQWKVGDRGDIKFDVASPGRSVWIGKGEGP